MPRRLPILILAATLTAGESPAWPRFNGPQGDGWSPETGINKDWGAKAPAELWRVKLGDRGYAGPAAAAGSVYIVDHEGSKDIVRCLSLDAGTETWRFAYEDAAKEKFGFARATPALAGGAVFTLSRLGRLHRLDGRTGAMAWMVDTQAEFSGKMPEWEYSSSPIVVSDLVIVSPGGKDAVLVAIDLVTGKVRWKGGGSDIVGYATPVVQDGRLLAMTGQSLLAADLKDGSVQWSLPWKTSYNINCAAPIVTDAGIFITSGYKHGCALVGLEGGKPKTLWENKSLQSHISTPIHHQGFIYGTTDPGALVCLEAKTGAERWREKGFGKGGLMAIDGALIVQDDKSGEVAMVALDPAGFKELGRIKPFKGDGDFWAPPIVCDKRLITRSKKELVCYDLR